MTLQPPPIRVLLQRAEKAAKRGDYDIAQASYRAVLERFPKNTAARTGLRRINAPDASLTQAQLGKAVQFFQKGQYASALSLSLRMLDANPNDAHFLDIAAASHRKQGNPEMALPLYDRALAQLDTAALWSSKATALIELSHYQPALMALAKAATFAPTESNIWTLIALCERETGRLADARQSVDIALAHTPGHSDAKVEKGKILLAQQDPAGADQILRSALIGSRSDAVIYSELGRIANAMGKRSDASSHYRDALRLSPKSAAIHHNYALTHRYVADDPHIRQLHDLLADDNASAQDQAYLHFAMFQALDQLDQPKVAFDHLLKGNALRKQILRYDAERELRRLEQLASLHIPPLTDPYSGPRPLFITGLPRSGTTLLEKRLADRFEIHPAGELPCVHRSVQTVLSQHQGRIGPDALLALQDLLRDQLTPYSAGHAVFIDKMPLNFRYLQVIAAALPEASFVFLDRDPMAVGWSLFKQCFDSNGNGFCYDMQDIAAYAGMTKRVMAAHQQTLGARLTPLRYEDMINDLDGVVDDLAKTLALPRRTSPQTVHAITTASNTIVRGPLQLNRNKDWLRYAQQLEPMRVALATTP